jgi:hypothetical protein
MHVVLSVPTLGVEEAAETVVRLVGSREGVRLGGRGTRVERGDMMGLGVCILRSLVSSSLPCSTCTSASNSPLCLAA